MSSRGIAFAPLLLLSYPALLATSALYQGDLRQAHAADEFSRVATIVIGPAPDAEAISTMAWKVSSATAAPQLEVTREWNSVKWGTGRRPKQRWFDALLRSIKSTYGGRARRRGDDLPEVICIGVGPHATDHVSDPAQLGAALLDQEPRLPIVVEGAAEALVLPQLSATPLVAKLRPATAGSRDLWALFGGTIDLDLLVMTQPYKWYLHQAGMDPVELPETGAQMNPELHDLVSSPNRCRTISAAAEDLDARADLHRLGQHFGREIGGRSGEVERQSTSWQRARVRRIYHGGLLACGQEAGQRAACDAFCEGVSRGLDAALTERSWLARGCGKPSLYHLPIAEGPETSRDGLVHLALAAHVMSQRSDLRLLRSAAQSAGKSILAIKGGR